MTATNNSVKLKRGQPSKRDYVRKKAVTVADICSDFSRTTSSHGVPQIGYAGRVLPKFFWSLLFTLCILMFSYQAFKMVKKFLSYEKTVQMELRFEAAPFPAVTVCNINPYKYSLATAVESVEATMKVFDHVKSKSGKEKQSHHGHKMKKRSDPSSFAAAPIDTLETLSDAKPSQQLYTPVYLFCSCANRYKECLPIMDPTEPSDTKCYCFRDNQYKSIWPCYDERMWTFLECDRCSLTGRCSYPVGRLNDTAVPMACLCQHVTNFCIKRPSQEIEKIGDPMLFTSTTPPPTTTTTTTTTTTSTTTTSTTTEPPETTPSDQLLEVLGFQGMTDDVAIVTKAKENLLFTMASLDLQTRIRLSYTREELIRSCVFNGKQCDYEEDFKLHVDPVFGNCYTFNFNPKMERTNSRAGPMYGLRMMVYVNVSDYMPTTEAAGIRLAIHKQGETAFPDTFGYSAPTGMISSFGLKVKNIERLPKPYGDCVFTENMEDYIFDENYSTEGCFRSCFQKLLLRECGCGDPRFPVPPGMAHCRADNPKGRDCLDSVTKSTGGFHGVQGCQCHQPCVQLAFGVTFSCAKWPSDFFKVNDDCHDEVIARCNQEFSDNAALIEVYYEQLNFEQLTESEAYGLVSLAADFGGQLGLWMGFSCITIVEYLVLFVSLITFCFQCGKHKTPTCYDHDGISSIGTEANDPESPSQSHIVRSRQASQRRSKTPTPEISGPPELSFQSFQGIYSGPSQYPDLHLLRPPLMVSHSNPAGQTPTIPLTPFQQRYNNNFGSNLTIPWIDIGEKPQ